MSRLQNIFGWTDPRVVFKDDDVHINTLHPPGHITTEYTDVPTETLKNLWMARFGSRAVTLKHMDEIREEQIVKVAQELMNRNLVSHYTDLKIDTDEKITYYVLGRRNGNY
jgi:hypothetical protein